MCIEVKLFKFSIPEWHSNVYIYSLKTDVKYLRKQLGVLDSGSIPNDIWDKICSEGSIVQIEQLSQVPEYELNYLPYNCSDLSWTFDLTIKEFFDPEILRKYI